MATEATLARAYIHLIPTAKGAHRAIASAIVPAADKAGDTAGRSLGGRLASGAARGLKVTAAGIATIGGVLTALAAKGGIDRSLNIEDAQAKLRGLGHDAGTVQTVMDSALASVKGTAFGLDSAVTSAASAIAAGIKPGQDLTRYLTTVADAAAIANVPLDEMGAIFNGVQASGKAYTGELNQLAERGVPVFQWLADEYGVTRDALNDMVKEGEVDAATFRKVIADNIGGAALESGNTTRGALANLGAAFSRFGVGLVGGPLSHAQPLFVELTETVDGLSEAIAPGMERFNEWLGPRLGGAIDGLSEKVLGVVSLIQGDFTPAFGQAFDVHEDSPIVERLFRIRDGIVGVVGLLRGDFTPELRNAFGWEEDSPVVGMVLDARDAVGELVDRLGSADLGSIVGQVAGLVSMFSPLGIVLRGMAPHLPVLAESLGRVGSAVGGALGALLPVVAQAFADVATALAGTIAAVLPELVPVFEGIAEGVVELTPSLVALVPMVADLAVGLIELLTPILANEEAVWAIGGAFIAWKGAVAGFALGQFIGSVAAATGAVWGKVAAFGALAVAKVRDLAQTVALHAMYAGPWLVSVLRSTGALIAQSAAWVAHGVALGAARAATLVMAGAQRALNLVMSANPIGLVIAAIAALVGALVWLYNNNETARAIIDGAWQGIKDAVSTVGEWFTETLVPGVQKALDIVVLGFETARDGIGAAFDAIRRAAAVPVNFVIDTVYNNGIRKAWNALADAVGLDNLTLPRAQTVSWGSSAAPSPGGRRSIAAAEGGVLPGYTPGRDVHHFVSPTGGELHLSGGEGIIRPDALARLGGKAWLDRQNRTRGRVGGSSFADGGIFEGIGNVVRSVAGFLTDPIGTARRLILEPAERIWSAITDTTWGKLLVEVPRAAVTGVVDKAKELVGGLIGSGGDSTYDGPVGAWTRPSSGRVTSRYGARWGALHAGVDFAGGGRTLAAAAGRVARLGFGAAAGRTGRAIVLDHGNNVFTYYGHNPLGSLPVSAGDTVEAGQHIGYEGTTGNVTGKHVHFETWRGGWGRAVDPGPFMRARGVPLYDNGGLLPTGVSVVENRTGKPEAVFTPGQLDALTRRGMGDGDRWELVLDDGTTLRGYVRREAGALIGDELRDLGNRSGGSGW